MIDPSSRIEKNAPPDETSGPVEAKTPESNQLYFLVTSHGWSGSTWLACALNLHDDITCGHSSRNLLAAPDIHRPDVLRGTTEERHESYAARSKRPLDDYYDELENMGDTLAYGMVHTFRLRDLPGQKKKFPIRRDISILNLVRHPVSLVNSGFGELRRMIEYDIGVLFEVVLSLHGVEAVTLALGEKHDLNLCDREVMCFLGAAYHLLHLRMDLEAVPTAQHIVMERATAEREYFEYAVRCLTGERIVLSRDYLDRVFSLDEVNSHRIGGRKKTPAEECYKSWRPWQRDVFRQFLDASGIEQAYTKLDYDFSFV